MPYDIEANKNDMAQAVRNAIACKERGEENGAAYFLRVADFHFSDLKFAIANQPH